MRAFFPFNQKIVNQLGPIFDQRTLVSFEFVMLSLILILPISVAHWIVGEHFVTLTYGIYFLGALLGPILLKFNQKYLYQIFAYYWIILLCVFMNVAGGGVYKLQYFFACFSIAPFLTFNNGKNKEPYFHFAISILCLVIFDWNILPFSISEINYHSTTKIFYSLAFILAGYCMFYVYHTKVRRTQERADLEKLNATKSANMALIGQLAQGMAHEINNPLSVIKASAGNVLGHIEKDAFIDTELVVNKMQKIDEATNRISKIIINLKKLSMNNVDSNEVIEIDSTINTIITLLKPQITLNDISIKLDIDPSLYVFGNRSEITQAFYNVILNAIQALEEDCHRKEISISSHKRDEKIFITVQDTGPGIEQSIMDKIMDPFYTTKGHMKASGLGLSVTSSIVSSHGGEFYLNRVEDKTTFIFEFPDEV